MCCCTSESYRSLCIVFRNPRGFNAQMGLMITWKVCEVMSKHILNRKSPLNLKRIQEIQVKYVVAQVSQIDRFALNLEIPVDLMLEWDLRSHRRCVKSGLNTFEPKIAIESQKNSRSTVKCVVALLRQTDRFTFYVRIPRDLLL
ncbi:uncharacterized protein G2W53_001289 [Senna tora]|uniref:Uncharacterized protein n=1 Tax=Senna tora TaxID=362788 RepID=A0A834XHD8_9FABA|nr:uncharacterized protein G2W53_001289 [Senna tora]